jgi:uncharacterized protein (TIGR02117 family)
MRRILPAVILIAAALGGCAVGAPDCPPLSAGKARTVSIVKLGWHAGIALPARAIDLNTLPEAADFARADYLEFGWGERDYYMAQRPSLWDGAAALLWRSSAVIHVAAVAGSVSSFFPGARITKLEIGEEGFAKLVRYVADSFERGGLPKAAPLAVGKYPDSRFYAARGKFSVCNTCNVWLERGLEEAGCRR